jgi:hypothetical protein
LIHYFDLGGMASTPLNNGAAPAGTNADGGPPILERVKKPLWTCLVEGQGLENFVTANGSFHRNM